MSSGDVIPDQFLLNSHYAWLKKSYLNVLSLPSLGKWCQSRGMNTLLSLLSRWSSDSRNSPQPIINDPVCHAMFLDISEIKNGVLITSPLRCRGVSVARGGVARREVKRDGRSDEGETARIKMPHSWEGRRWVWWSELGSVFQRLVIWSISWHSGFHFPAWHSRVRARAPCCEHAFVVKPYWRSERTRKDSAYSWEYWTNNQLKEAIIVYIIT